MASIVELRQMSNDKLDELLENAREEMFNLRFQQASSGLENTARLKEVRREIAQLETVLHTRDLAIKAAAGDPLIAAALQDSEWTANARYVYEEASWEVSFNDKAGDNLAMAQVDLNVKQPKRHQGGEPSLVVGRDISG